MKNKLNKSDIRSLLHKYYEADTTPEEEHLLESFFHDSPAEEIPEDMNADRKIFSAFIELHADSSETDVPADLVKSVTSLTEGYADSSLSKNQRNWNRFIVYAAAAACLSIVLTLGIRWIASTTLRTSEASGHIAVVPFEQPKHHSAINHEVNEVSDPADQEYKAPSNSQKKNKATVKTASDADEDGFIEITDPEEAKKIIMEIGNLLNANSQKTNEALQHIEKTVDEYRQLTKSILQ